MRRPALPEWVGLGTLLAGLLLAAAAAAWQHRYNQALLQQRFEAVAGQVTSEITERMGHYEAGLRALRGAVLAAGGRAVRREQVRAYHRSRDLDREFPGAHGFGVIWRVPADERSAFVAMVRRQGIPDFQVQQVRPHDGELRVITHIEPLERNGPAVGLDVASEANRMQASQTALRTGSATLSGPITLVQVVGQVQRAFLLMLPIYPAGSQPRDEAGRIAAGLGWTYAPLLIEDVLQGLHRDGGGYKLQLRDLDDPRSPDFYTRRDTAGAETLPGAPRRSIDFPVYGRRWRAELQATPAFAAGLGLQDPVHTGLAVAGVSALLAMLTYLLVQGASRTQRERIEKARRAAIVEGSEDAIIGATLDGVITEWNGGAERLFGYGAASALGCTMASLLLPPERMHEDDELRAAIAAGRRVPPFDTTRRTHDGSLIAVSLTAAPILDASGQCVGMSKTVRDMRQAQRDRQALADLNASLEQQVADRTARLDSALRDNTALLQTLHRFAIVAVADADGTVREVNEGFCRVTGHEVEDLVGRDLFTLEAGVQGQAHWQAVRDRVTAGHAWRGEICHHAKDGSLYWADSIIVPFIGADGQIEKLVSIRADISERRRAELELRRTLAKLRSVLDAATQVAIIATQPDGTVSIFNRGAENLLGHDADEVIGRANLLQFHDPAELQARAAALCADGDRRIDGLATLVDTRVLGDSAEWSYVRRDGRRLPVSLVVTEVRDDDGELLGYLGVAHDISARQQYELTLREAMERANQANRAKSQFLANMSHEIRTPMNAVIGLTYLLERSPLDDEQAGFVAKIKLASKSLLSNINDVLDLSKIEAAEMQIERAPFAPAALLHEVAELMAVQADAKGIDFGVDIDERLPPALEGDPTRLRQVLTNLLSNAIKFTERGSVRLQVQVVDATPGAVRLRCSVRDSGIGIAADALERLFQPFVQADTSTTRRYGGTGLGLSIVKQLSELMGGEVGVSSTPGKGSVFRVELPFPLCSDTVLPVVDALPADGGPGLTGVRVLVVDDSDINLEVARRILRLEGAAVTLARNGQQAVDRLLATPDAVDVVLMDVQMPVLDGHDATRRIRSGLGLKRLPVIALTAGVTVGEQARAAAAGMNDVVGKPFDPQALVACIRRHVALGATLPAARGTPAAPAVPWPQIAGIDAADAGRRMGQDAALFLGLLRRMLADFADLGTLPQPDGDDAAVAQAAQALAARLHRLKGTAGTLGAKALEAQAAAAEAACLRIERGERASAAALAALVQPLVQQLAALQQAAQPVLEQREDEPEPQAGSAEPVLDVQALRALLAQLQASDLGALQCFAELGPALRRRLGRSAHAALRTQMDDLDFGAVARVLAPLAATPA
ncbi:PAS domain S-box protein [Rubrivivax sp. RP6-9]|uniref:PAS domain-containing hybrid sensor histidine kinase/response regulator n=1 Tax=Rubrivivax sp. RP6-9 TaxID=3415750 RepID=UPI003CC6A9AA